MVKKLNNYLLTNKIRHKHLIKVHSFSGAKISCMKATSRDINLDQIALHADTNYLKTENTVSQIAKATATQETSLQNGGNTNCVCHCSMA